MALILSLSRGSLPPGERREVPLTGTDLVVGSAPDCDWRLEGGVAARHCQFGFRNGQWMVVDLGGGTLFNARPLDRPLAIGAGDVVTIGGCVVSVAPATGTAAPRGVDPALGGAAGALLRQFVAGVVAQLAQRARAKSEMGVEATQFSPGAINPLKALPADRAVAALLAPQPGMMPPAQAVADAFADLEAHQAATLAGMQQALAATLERFSPAAIQKRAQDRGLLARMMPGARAAGLWQAYEREFDGVVKGSSDAFVDLFAEEFRKAYKSVSSEPRRPS